MNKKITAEESLNKILLYMKYDSKNTLSENMNKKLILEEECPNTVSMDFINNIAKNCGSAFKKMDAPFIRMGYGEERAKDIYNEISKLANKNFYDDITGECVPGMNEFNQLYKSASSGWFTSGGDFETDMNSLIKDYYKDDVNTLRYLNGALKIYKGQLDPSKVKKNTPSPDKTPTTTPTTTPAQSNKQNLPIPSELSTIEDGVRKFQTWMETNHKGWYPGKKPVDGIFGNYTSKAWSNTEYKNEFLKSLSGTSQPVANNPYAGGTTDDDIEG